MNNLKYFLVFIISLSHAQVGINTSKPLQTLHVDPNKNTTSSGSAVSNDNDDFVVTSSGNVGIGTTSPATRLHIIGDGTNHPLNIKNIKTLSNSSSSLYIDNSGNVGKTTETAQQSATKNFAKNLNVSTKQPGIALNVASNRNYMPIVGTATAPGVIVVNTLNVVEIANDSSAGDYITIPSTGFYKIQLQGAYQCSRNSNSIAAELYAMDMVVYKKSSSASSFTQVERQRLIAGLNDDTSYNATFYTILELKNGDKLSFALAPGLKDDGSVISSSNVVKCGVGTPTGASYYSLLSLSLL